MKGHKTKVYIHYILAFLMVLSFILPLAVNNGEASAQAATLSGIGPVNPANGYPLFYKDVNGLPLELCLDNNGKCVLLADPTFNPALPVVFPTNFPSEAFYYIADSNPMSVGPTGAGRARLRIALEGAFGTPPPAAGQQMTFLRINFSRTTGLTPNSTFTATHPFGTFTFITNATGTAIGSIGNQAFRAQDGCAGPPCDFTILLPAPTTHISRFLTWTGLPVGGLLDPVTGNHYIGDAVTPHTITGSPLGQNFVRIDGPNIGGTGINTIQTDLFTVAGKILSPAIKAINVTPAAPLVITGSTLAMAASAIDQFGAAIAAAMTWSSSDPAVGTIDPVTGLFTATGLGITTVSATSDVTTGTAIVTVVSATPGLSTISASPATATILVGGTQAFTASILDQFGNPFVAAVTWNSSNPLVGSIDPTTGVFTAVGAGTTSVSATSGTVSGAATVRVTTGLPALATINVTPATVSLGLGINQTFTASTLDQFGVPIAAPVTWSSTPPTIGAISAAGVFSSVGAGTATITATSGLITGSATITVTSAGLSGVGPVNPATGFPAYYRDANGLALEQCLENNGKCVLLADATFNPALPVTFPANFPGEAFYYIADSSPISIGPAGAGRARLRLALEGAFGAGTAAAGQQMTFLRINLSRTTGLEPGKTFTVTHPFGTFTFTSDATGSAIAGGAGQAFRTQDGCAGPPCDFTILLPATATRISTFLTWTGLPAGGLLDPVTGNSYIGDAVTPHTITGSPLGQNFLRIDGPNIGGRGINRVQTDLFTVAGKISAAAGAAPLPPTAPAPVPAPVPAPAPAPAPGLPALEIFPAIPTPVLVPTLAKPNVDRTAVPAGLPSGSIAVFTIQGVVNKVDNVKGEWQIGTQPKFVYTHTGTRIVGAPRVGDTVRIIAYRSLATGPLVADVIALSAVGPTKATTANVLVEFMLTGAIGATNLNTWNVGGVTFVINDPVTPAVITPGLTGTATVLFAGQ